MWTLTIALVTFVASNSTVGMVPGAVTYRFKSEAECQVLRQAYRHRPLNNAWAYTVTDCEREAEGRER